MRLVQSIAGRRESGDAQPATSTSSTRLLHHGQSADLEQISIVSSNATPSQVTYGSGLATANGPRIVPGTITSTGRIGERLSISGTRLDSGSPVRFGPKSSAESLRNSAARHSLLDLVGCKFGVSRKPPQTCFSSSRDSLTPTYPNRTVCLPSGIASSDSDIAAKAVKSGHRPSRVNFDGAATATAPTASTTGRASYNNARGSICFDGGRQKNGGPRQYRGDRPAERAKGIRWSFVFDPAGQLCYYWNMVVSMAFLYNFWVIIYRFAFSEINRNTLVVWFCLDYLCDLLYVIDILFHFRTGYLEDGVLQTDAVKLRNHYMNSTTFYIDCLCLLPLDFLYLSIGFNSILRSFRIVKIYRFWAFMDRTERHTNYPNLIRSGSLIHYLLVIFHWNGCLYHIIYKNNGFGSKNWVYTDSDAEDTDTVKRYLQSYYWCTLALTTIGDLPKPRSNGEYAFVICQLLFGLLLFATVLGHVASIVVSVSAGRKEFQAKLDGVKTYMRMRRVPNHLQTKVIKWFDYLWLTQKCSDEERAISCLPDKLKAEIAINVHLDTLKRVEIFQNTEAGFLCELVLKLRPVLFSPGDYICRKGEVGKEMYIVSRGKLQVVTDDGKSVLAVLRAGSYFGEISILNMGTAGNRRTASVRSVGYSDLFVLSKKDMWDVLKEYPTARIRLEAIATKRLEKYKTDPSPDDKLEGLVGRRCKSTPGIVESQIKVDEEMWMQSSEALLRPINQNRSSFSPAASPSFRSNAAATLESPLSSKYSLDQEHHHHNAQDAQKPTTTTPSTEPSMVSALKAEINRLQERLIAVETENLYLNKKVTQQRWDMDHRLAEIEMQICKDNGSSNGSSCDDNERNKESII
ncbi:cyclic nucleotide-gated cation channel alpha-3 isoform X2 [Adelges cooleyi]|uniref:cyclic nucleotide-gated cation channel alpha-3 isoform X2 n=1 Tax=Adelges cooleyi TaxID=133065 RepID=UPI002180241A|nr:cyclic nucleotide-gated cation channel alpha-3 isoform X2 [Adelges cooleyi]